MSEREGSWIDIGGCGCRSGERTVVRHQGHDYLIALLPFPFSARSFMEHTQYGAAAKKNWLNFICF